MDGPLSDTFLKVKLGILSSKNFASSLGLMLLATPTMLVEFKLKSEIE